MAVKKVSPPLPGRYVVIAFYGPAGTGKSMRSQMVASKKKIDMNIANKLTILRVLLIPVFIVLYMTKLLPAPWNRIVALAVFALASYTDHLDGKIARERGLVTDFGKFMDPLADKLLVISALICFVERGELAGWIVIIIVAIQSAPVKNFFKKQSQAKQARGVA